MTKPWENDPASQAQKDHLIRMVGQRMFYGPDVTVEEAIARMTARIAEPLTKGQASEMLDEMYRVPGYAKDQIPAQQRTLDSLRYRAGEYAVFGLGVSREDTIARVEETIALGMSEDAAQKLLSTAYRAKPHPTEKSPLPLSVIEGIDGIEIGEGYYAVILNDVLRFYRIYTPNTGEWEGVAVIRRYASQNELPITPAEARDALHAINADVDAAAYRFADEFTRCSACSLQLTDQVSRLLSVGPTCRGFKNHTGLRREAADVDRNPARKQVYRGLRAWAIEQGYTDPRGKDQREAMEGQMTASRLASAWSGLPGLLALPLDEALARCKAAVAGDLHPDLHAALLAAPADTVLILIESKVLSGPVVQALADHPDKKVQARAADFFLSLLG